ncbi:MAG: ABC transporter permease [Acidobacteriota bacterium]
MTAAGAGITAPLTGTSYTVTGLELELPSGEKRGFERLNVQSVMPGYLEAIDMRLVRGRWFADADYAGGRAVLVDQAFCRKHLDGVDPLQARVIWGRSALPIVGIVADVRRDGPFSASADTVYAMEAGHATTLKKVLKWADTLCTLSLTTPRQTRRSGGLYGRP